MKQIKNDKLRSKFRRYINKNYLHIYNSLNKKQLQQLFAALDFIGTYGVIDIVYNSLKLKKIDNRIVVNYFAIDNKINKIYKQKFIIIGEMKVMLSKNLSESIIKELVDEATENVTTYLNEELDHIPEWQFDLLVDKEVEKLLLKYYGNNRNNR